MKPILVKFQSHKAKTRLYRARTKLKNFKVSQNFPEASAPTCVASERIFINENLTQFRKYIVTKANKKRKAGLLLSVWTLDGNIFVKTSPEGTPIRIFEESDLENISVGWGKFIWVRRMINLLVNHRPAIGKG